MSAQPPHTTSPTSCREHANDAQGIVLAPFDERNVYGAPKGARPKAFAITLLIHAIVIGLLALKWSGSYKLAPPSSPLVVTLLPLASPPEPEISEQEKPIPEQKAEMRQAPPRTVPVERSPTPLPTEVALPPSFDVQALPPSPPRTEAAVRKATSAPPAPQPQSNAPDSWEGRVLAKLEKFRRYPGPARSARQQGVVYIRFRINRDGHILSSTVTQSSSYPTLDRAALETLRRAEPLPEIPDDRPDEIELVVPVEFYISMRP